MLTVFADVDGTVIGETRPFVPAGGVVVSAPSRLASVVSGDASAGSATGDTASGFNIQLDFSGGGLTASQQAVFAGAAARWESILTGDIPDVGVIDDVKIFASGRAIDGVGTILGQAGYTALRSGSYLPYQGTMSFDSADLANMEANGSLQTVIVHEMGHVLGVGSLWFKKGLILGSGTSAARFVGTNALTEYRRFTGDAAATSIPVETDGGPGTADAHWDDATFGNELMTGYLSGGFNPLSRMSAASLIDMGYPLVNVDAADLYTLGNALPTIGTLTASGTTAIEAPVSLSLTSIHDADGIGSVSFYRESNGIAGLQASGTVTPDTLIVNNVGANGSAQVATTGWSAGTYTFYARAADARGALSAVATATASVTPTTATPTPAAPDLTTATDTGESALDNLTAINRPTFAGVATPLATVSLFANGQPIGSTAANANGEYSITPTAALADGRHLITVTAAAPGTATSGTSAALAVTIDTVGPAITAFGFDRERTQQIYVTFNDATIIAGLTDRFATLVNESTGQTIELVSQAGNAATGVVTLAADGPLADGRYRLSVASGGVRDAAGNAMLLDASFAFTQLAGDANGDGAVNFDDLILVAKHFYVGSGHSASSGNVDYSSDGVVDFDDLILIARKYGTTVDATGTTASPATAATSTPVRLVAIVDSAGDTANGSSRVRRSLLRAAFLG